MIDKNHILNEVEKFIETDTSDKTAKTVLNQILEQVQPISFRKIAFPEFVKLEKRQKEIQQAYLKDAGEIDEKIYSTYQDELELIKAKLEKAPKVTQKHYMIITIEKLLQLAQKHSWDLCQRQGHYYIYNGEYWNVFDADELKSFLGEVAEKMGVPKYDSRFYDFRDRLFKQFETTAHLPEPKIPKDTVLINLLNGTFEITEKNQRLREFSSKDFITYQLNFKYQPKATAPLFQKYLNEVLPDQESQRVLAEFMGYVFTRNLKLEKVLFLYGSGRNGKSVMFEIITAMLGADNISGYSLSSITDEKGYHRAKLVNKLLNWASDIGDRLQSNTFKQLASGEPIEARLPHKEPFIIENVCKFAFNTNVLPVDVEHNKAFFERFLIIPFNTYIPPDKRDAKLPEKIISKELPGVFNWVLEGLKRLLEQGRFSPCKASDETLEQFQKESDSVAMFLEENNYQPSSESWVQAKPVYQDYKDYCFSEGLKPLARKNFHKRLEGLNCFLSIKNVGKVIHIEKKAGEYGF